MQSLEARVSRMEAQAAPADLLLVRIRKFCKPVERGALCASVGSDFVNREDNEQEPAFIERATAWARGMSAKLVVLTEQTKPESADAIA
jgi:hypothetical protein